MKPSSTARRSHRGSKLKSRQNELCLSIPSTLSAVEPVCWLIRNLLERQHREEMGFAVELLARECLNNAILHGNRGQASRRVRFRMRVGRKLIYLRIADQGKGFDWRTRKPSWPAGSTPTGRGLMTASAYAERIAFNRRGNEITLWLKTAPEER